MHVRMREAMNLKRRMCHSTATFFLLMVRSYHAIALSFTFRLTQAGEGRSQVLFHYVKLASVSVDRDRNSGGGLDRVNI